MTDAPRSLLDACEEMRKALRDVAPKMTGLALHLREMGLDDKARALERAGAEIGQSVTSLAHHIARGALRDVGSAITGMVEGFADKSSGLAVLAGELRDMGLDDHAQMLEGFSAAMLRAIRTSHEVAGAHGMLDETLPMSMRDVGSAVDD